jgi:dipeptidyl aminopeptidase/acylaminoacyl peptidase
MIRGIYSSIEGEAMRQILIFIAVLLCSVCASAENFTIQQALSAPFTSNLIAAPAKGRVAWISNKEGRRNVWVAEPGSAAYSSKQLTHYNQDDGQDVGELAWTPDGESIAYTRGGDFEAPEKPAPNPAQIPLGVEQDVWLISVNGGEPRKVDAGRSPAISSDGSLLVYLHSGEIWSLSLKDTNAKAALLFKARGAVNSLRWSPDSKSLAFVSSRGDYSFVGVYLVEAKQLTYLDPGTTLDGEPVWSPDSRRIAFLRIPPSPGIDFKPQRSGEPWSIEMVDVQTGNPREVWRAQKGQGSVFHDIVADNQLFWTAGGLIVFPWEADGWTHLYAVSAEGGTAKLLTPGAFEVEHVTLSADRKRIVYSSNQYSTDPLDQDRRHIWSVDLSSVSGAGGAPVALTTGSGIEVSPVVTSDGSVAVLHSDTRVPMRPALVSGGKLKDLAPQAIPADFPAAKFVVPQQVIFTAADGMRIHGQLFLPANDGGKHPAVVFFHGGSRRQMLLGWHYMEYYSNAYGMNQYLASLGYVVLSANYRSGIGYGLDFREALNYGAAGASEFNDVQGAGLYLRSRTDVDPARIGSWGGSYGGYLTALALARASDLFAAGVDLHGVHDWNLELGLWNPSYNPNADPNAARVSWESSPLSSIKTWRSPVLLIQGDDDRNVQFAQTVNLAAALRTQGVYFEQHVFPDEIHDFLLHRNWVTAYTLGADFFNRKLAAGH